MIVSIRELNQQNQSLPESGYSLVWIRKGMCGAFVNGHYTRYPNNTIVCINNVQLTKVLQNISEGIIISFSSAFLSRIQAEMLLWKGNFPGVIVPERLQSEVTEEIKLVLSFLIKESKSVHGIYTKEFYEYLMKLLVFQVFRDSIKAVSVLPYPPEDIRLVNKFVEMVKANFMTMKKVSDYANILCVSPNYLNIKVKRVSGFTASYHIQQFILAEAVGKARNEGMGLKQIAYYLGYEDIAYFSKFFKKIAGRSFTEFRMEALKG